MTIGPRYSFRKLLWPFNGYTMQILYIILHIKNSTEHYTIDQLRNLLHDTHIARFPPSVIFNVI